MPTLQSRDAARRANLDRPGAFACAAGPDAKSFVQAASMTPRMRRNSGGLMARFCGPRRCSGATLTERTYLRETGVGLGLSKDMDHAPARMVSPLIARPHR